MSNSEVQKSGKQNSIRKRTEIREEVTPNYLFLRALIGFHQN